MTADGWAGMGEGAGLAFESRPNYASGFIIFANLRRTLFSREEEAKFKHTLHRISKKIGTQSKMQQCYTNIEGRSKIKLGTAVGMIMVFQRYPYHNVL